MSVVVAVGMWATRLRCPHVHSPSAAARTVLEEAVQLPTRRIKRALLVFRQAVGDERTTVVVDGCGHHLRHWPLSSPGVLVQAGDDLATEEP